MEAAHAWLFVVNLVGLRGDSFVLENLSLMMFPDDTLKASHASTKTDFMWQGKNYFGPYFNIHAAFAML